MKEKTDNFPYGYAAKMYLVSVVLAIAQAIVNGLTLVIMWEWFVQKLLPSLSPISTPWAIGLMLTTSLFSGRGVVITPQDKKTLESKAEQELRKVPETSVGKMLWNGLLSVVTSAAATLLTGWIVKQFL